ncbi:MAG TPA: CoA transferase [Bryobacteraceae bacterium]|nr:CoA transferase [Bryobacteraceae bacterium]
MILSGLRVIDCGTYIAGPAAAAILSDFGAEVIKIERPPHGDPYRYLPRVPGMPVSDQNYCWILDDRNKKSIALDLSDAEAHQVLLKLVATADIFITNYQPQSLRKFRLTYEDLAPANDRLIHASITGYGEHGEDAEKPGYDATAYWARSGLMFGMHNGDAEPVQSPAGFGDHPTSVTLFASIMMALYQRLITGRGTRVYTSLMANGIWSHGCAIQAALCGATFLPKWTRKNAINPLVNHYLARDGHRMFFCLLEPVRDWVHLCQALGFEDLRDDPRFSSTQARQANSAELVKRIDEVIATRDMAEWAVIFKKYDLVWGPVPSANEVATDPQAQIFFSEIAPGLKTIQNPLNIEGMEKAEPSMPPGIGEHTREVLTSLGLDDTAIEQMIQRGAAKCA